ASGRLGALDRLVFALHALFHEAPQHLNRHGVIDPGVAQAVAQLLAEDAEQLALARGQGPAAGPGGVADGVEDVHLSRVGRVEDTAPAVQLRVAGDYAVLDGHRLLAGGDLKLVAERQDPVARLRQAGLDRLGNVEEGQILDLVDDFHQGRVEHRLRNDLFG